MQKIISKLFFIIEQIQKYRKCPALSSSDASSAGRPPTFYKIYNYVALFINLCIDWQMIDSRFK